MAAKLSKLTSIALPLLTTQEEKDAVISEWIEYRFGDNRPEGDTRNLVQYYHDQVEDPKQKLVTRRKLQLLSIDDNHDPYELDVLMNEGVHCEFLNLDMFSLILGQASSNAPVFLSRNGKASFERNFSKDKVFPHGGDLRRNLDYISVASNYIGKNSRLISIISLENFLRRFSLFNKLFISSNKGASLTLTMFRLVKANKIRKCSQIFDPVSAKLNVNRRDLIFVLVNHVRGGINTENLLPIIDNFQNFCLMGSVRKYVEPPDNNDGIICDYYFKLWKHVKFDQDGSKKIFHASFLPSNDPSVHEVPSTEFLLSTQEVISLARLQCGKEFSPSQSATYQCS